MADKPMRSLLQLPGVLQSANRELDNEASSLVARIRKNQTRGLGLIMKGHTQEALKEQTLSAAEQEQSLNDLEAALGDNGGPSLQDPEDEATVKLREELAAAKVVSENSSNSSSGEK